MLKNNVYTLILKCFTAKSANHHLSLSQVMAEMRSLITDNHNIKNWKSLKYCKNHQNVTQRHKVNKEQIPLGKWHDRLAWLEVNTNLQSMKTQNLQSTEMRSACPVCSGRPPKWNDEHNWHAEGENGIIERSRKAMKGRERSEDKVWTRASERSSEHSSC